MKIEERQEIERVIVEAAAIGLIAGGYKIAVYDGKDVTLEATTDVAAILAAMFTTDEDYFFVYPKDGGKKVGIVQFVHGNDDWDVIADYSTVLGPELDFAERLSEVLDNQRNNDETCPAVRLADRHAIERVCRFWMLTSTD